MTDIDKAIENLDLQLFAAIESQSTEEDKRSLLACQAAVRELRPVYVYLEIGSYLGGSVQPHLLDPKCKVIYSIDKRPPSQPDERGFVWKYENNSTARMLANLASVGDISKVITIDGDAATVDTSLIRGPVDLCFIDGEHTDSAVKADFQFCLRVIGRGGLIVFHDAQITYNGIAACLEWLRSQGTEFNAYSLPNALFVVEVGDIPIHTNPEIEARLRNNYGSFLYALKENDTYRRFANRFPFGTFRRLMLRARGGNVSR
ncbi:MAG: class I SAM-dependent methyltransferase, partial [Acidobacteria bacterium]|nr:class I SAM-dependent methyltransferase [Acidobacteriota bacterium]